MQKKTTHYPPISLAAAIYRDIESIRTQSPLIHNITNWVVMAITANALLSLGASPIMAHAKEELFDLSRKARALVLNMGTLDSAWVEIMRAALIHAKQFKTPVIFDPVGAGATTYRTHVAREFIQQIPPTVIRGNASEIIALASSESMGTKGVDSIHSPEQAVTVARQLVTRNPQRVIVISGPVDICVSADQQWHIYNGTPLMTRVTGMGCTASALIAAFCAVNPNPLAAALHAMAVMGIAGELAEQHAQGPQSFQTLFIDTLHQITEADIAEKLRVEPIQI
ncbi:MAG: hydroxyethylthiazole kinase [Gammaproteobacteria bacterium]